MKTKGRPAANITGQRFRMLVALEYVPANGDGRAMWRCRCDCGNTVLAVAANLRSGNTKSCGCLRASTRTTMIGQRFGRLVVRAEAGRRGRHVAWLCACDCGGTAEVTTGNLKGGNVVGCGCARFDHHGKGTREFSIWLNMRRRCSDPKASGYENYGGRGITICPQWNESFAAFRRDMGECPAGGSIDRIDNDGPYSPENCRWATPSQQARNRRDARLVTVRGVTRPLSEWAEESGVGYYVLHARLRNGWTPERAIATPTAKRRAR